ncbi:PP2C family protein-serine/threonine phosphatase [Nocardioides donggukensis]|uniref:Serine/threonine-protein phosphatase n=1 Tax=Nocardioides donggukensis TaxID=2774019 RepID=A0A927PZC7_9ACTN|nr:protein phosphatase 2C domain-containing protein [Nocardioides donggukensis]MBD8869953.1 serine/threonine-protein phosphatase [Nocardioides donggukensis]
MLRFTGAGVTDVGRRRDNNEDSGFLGPQFALVADGVGGAAAGEVASATVTHVLLERIAGLLDGDPALALRDATGQARAALRLAVDADLQLAGMATTLTAVATDGARVVLAHVGDSRAYLLRDAMLHQVSTDHTYVQSLVDAGHLDPAAARDHPWRNVVLRSLHGGPARPLEHPDLVDLDAQPGDRILLCSDGLTDLVPPDRIGDLLGVPEPQAAAAALVQEALDRGGLDNVTCLVLDVVDGPPVTGAPGEPLVGQLLGAVRDPANIAGTGHATAH